MGASPFDPTAATFRTLASQKPLKQATEPVLGSRWLKAAPFDGVPADHFAIIATARPSVGAGRYEIRTISDDGIRVLVDECVVIDRLTRHIEAKDTAEVELAEGTHEIRVEYFETIGDAHLQFAMNRLYPADAGTVSGEAAASGDALAARQSDGPRLRCFLGGSPPECPQPMAEPVELLSHMDLARDATPGGWALEGESLVSKRSGEAALLLPYQPPEQFRVEATVQRPAGEAGIVLGMPVCGRRCLMTIDGWPQEGYLSGPEVPADGGLTGRTSRAFHGKLLPDDRRVRLECTVLRSGSRIEFHVHQDGAPVFSWMGDLRDLPLVDNAAGGDVDVIFLRALGTQVKVFDLHVVPISAEGTLVGFADPGVDSELSIAQRVLWKGGSLEVEDQGRTVVVHKRSQLPAKFTIRCVRIRGNPFFGNADLSLLANLPNLNRLELGGSLVDSQSQEVISQLPQIETLSLAHAQLEDEDLSCLSKCRNLRELELKGTHITDAGLDALLVLKYLSKLDLSLTDISTEGMARLRQSLPSCEVLDALNREIDLLALADTADGRVWGDWSRRDGQLTVSEGQGAALLAIPLTPPDEYDFHVKARRL